MKELRLLSRQQTILLDTIVNTDDIDSLVNVIALYKLNQIEINKLLPE